MIGDDHDSVVGADDVFDARHGLGVRGIETCEFAAQRRALRESPMQHARELHVDAIDGTAIELAGGVEALGWLADQREFFGRLECDLGRHGQLRRRLGELAEREALAAIDHRTGIDLEGVGRHAPLCRSGLHEHAARLCAGFAQLFPRITHAGAAAGDLCAKQVVGVHGTDRRRFDAYRLEGDAKLLGEQLRERCVDTLTHLGFIDEHRDGVVTRDAQPGDGLSASADSCGLAAATEPDAEHEAAAGQHSELQEVSACVVNQRVGFSVHHAFSFLSSSAARCTALRMRLYVPQRQMLPAMAASMSASVGEGFCASSAAADIS